MGMPGDPVEDGDDRRGERVVPGLLALVVRVGEPVAVGHGLGLGHVAVEVGVVGPGEAGGVAQPQAEAGREQDEEGQVAARRRQTPASARQDSTFDAVASSRAMPRDLRIALVGFGNVGRRFVLRLAGPYGRALRKAGVRPLLTGIATGRHGIAVDARGLDPRRCLRAVERRRLARGPAPWARPRLQPRLRAPRARRRAAGGHAHRPPPRRARHHPCPRSPAPGPARGHGQQGAGGLRPAQAARPGATKGPTVPARRRGHGRHPRLQPQGALPGGRADPGLPRDA